MPVSPHKFIAGAAEKQRVVLWGVVALDVFVADLRLRLTLIHRIHSFHSLLSGALPGHDPYLVRLTLMIYEQSFV